MLCSIERLVHDAQHHVFGCCHQYINSRADGDIVYRSPKVFPGSIVTVIRNLCSGYDRVQNVLACRNQVVMMSIALV